MMHGEQWRPHLSERVRKAVGSIRKEAWGELDLSSNVFRSSCVAVAVLYDRSPTVDHTDQAGEELGRLVASSGRWSLMQRVQRETIAYREMLLCCSASVRPDGSLEVQDRPVTPDLVEIEAKSDDPSTPYVIREWRPREYLGQWVWTRDVWSLADGGSYRIYVNDLDVTDYYVSNGNLPQRFEGETYPYKKADGTPVLPYGLWHGAVTGQIWDPFELGELVDGSLQCAVYWTFYGHVMLNCSWPQRYGINARAAGVSSDGTVDKVITDPSTVAMFEVVEESGGQPIIGQWQPGADPQVMADAISVYERRVAAYAGISPSDVQRVAGDPRSGFAIALNREAQREAQRRYEPVFRPSDEHYLSVTAVVCNAALGTKLFPEDGYRVTYAGLPASPEERQAEREHIEKLLSMGLMDSVTAYRQLHPELTQEQAREKLLEVRLSELRLNKEIAQLEQGEQNVRREPAINAENGTDGELQPVRGSERQIGGSEAGS